jgi:hypothetical protein
VIIRPAVFKWEGFPLMFPLIIVAFAGIGVTRLALLALELHESNNPVSPVCQSALSDQTVSQETLNILAVDPENAVSR